MSKFIKIYVKDGVEAVKKKLKQFHDRMIVDPTDPDKLSDKEK